MLTARLGVAAESGSDRVAIRAPHLTTSASVAAGFHACRYAALPRMPTWHLHFLPPACPQRWNAAEWGCHNVAQSGFQTGSFWVAFDLGLARPVTRAALQYFEVCVCASVCVC